MKLLLDTNVFVTDYKLSGSTFRLLEDAISRLGVQLFIPELIVEEVIGEPLLEFIPVIVELPAAALLPPIEELSDESDVFIIVPIAGDGD